MTERQEVAEKLRENSVAHGADEALQIICKCTIRAAKGSKSVMEVLADLIDPTCRIVYVDESYSTPNTGRVDEWHYECSRCCYELSDGEMDEFESGALPFGYCPHCGSRVVIPSE